MELPKDLIVTKDYLDTHPDVVFVYGDNLLRKGLGGAARLRNHPCTYGFITKKSPNLDNKAYFTVSEYRPVFERELKLLIHHITNHPEYTFLISKIGSGLANRYNIYEQVIEPELYKLERMENVVLLFDLQRHIPKDIPGWAKCY